MFRARETIFEATREYEWAKSFCTCAAPVPFSVVLVRDACAKRFVSAEPATAVSVSYCQWFLNVGDARLATG